MSVIGKPFGYVLWGVTAGVCLGIATGGLASPNFPIDGLIGAVPGALFGYLIENYASRATGTNRWHRSSMWFLILVVAPVLLCITIGALQFAWIQWFGQSARE